MHNAILLHAIIAYTITIIVAINLKSLSGISMLLECMFSNFTAPGYRAKRFT